MAICESGARGNAIAEDADIDALRGVVADGMREEASRRDGSDVALARGFWRASDGAMEGKEMMRGPYESSTRRRYDRRS
jgi:hypothetical protein